MVKPMADYRHIVAETKQRYNIRVWRWRRTLSGCAWRALYIREGVVNWIEAPYPQTPLGLAIFLHEVGHHAIGFDKYSLHCVDEFEAWRWALSRMAELNVRIDGTVLRRVNRSIGRAVSRSLTDGVRTLPERLRPYLTRAA